MRRARCSLFSLLASCRRRSGVCDAPFSAIFFLSRSIFDLSWPAVAIRHLRCLVDWKGPAA
ncbi:MAG: hypothetical protein DMF50_02375 [Acidobacteria bacterium]|nr:MAG: hypothetical protein DMF50_02375 [Acidobacteriota bacterium]